MEPLLVPLCADFCSPALQDACELRVQPSALLHMSKCPNDFGPRYCCSPRWGSAEKHDHHWSRFTKVPPRFTKFLVSLVFWADPCWAAKRFRWRFDQGSVKVPARFRQGAGKVSPKSQQGSPSFVVCSAFCGLWQKVLRKVPLNRWASSPWLLRIP